MFQILQLVCKTQGRAGLANLCWEPWLKIGPARLMPKAGTAKRRSSLSPHYFKGVDEESHNKVAVPFLGQTCQIRSNTVQCLDGFSCPDVSHIVPCGLMNAAFQFLKEDAKTRTFSASSSHRSALQFCSLTTKLNAGACAQRTLPQFPQEDSTSRFMRFMTSIKTKRWKFMKQRSCGDG